MRMLDGSIYFKSTVQNGLKHPKMSKAEESSIHFYSLVTITVTSRNLWKISKECFKFIKTLKNIPKIGQKIPSRGIHAANFSEYIDC